MDYDDLIRQAQDALDEYRSDSCERTRSIGRGRETSGLPRHGTDRSRSAGKSRRLSVVKVLALALVVADVFVQGFPAVVVAMGGKGPKIVKAIIYSDGECTNEVSSVGWGELRPGDSKSVTLYVKNTGTEPLTLQLSEGNWDPVAAADYMVLQWDYSGETVEVDAVIAVTLTLAVSENVDGVSYFTLEVFIQGSAVRGKERNDNKGGGKGNS